MKKTTIAVLASLVTWSHAGTFDFTDPKGVNTLALMLDSPLEPIVGWASGVTGKIQFDPLVPDAIEGKIEVASKNIAFAQERMTAKLQTAEWLDVAKHPTVSFTIKEFKDVKESGKLSFTGKLTGTFSLHGVDKPVSVDARLTVIPDGATQRGGGKGELMVLRSRFTIQRGDYGIKPGALLDKVANDIEVTVAISGYGK